MVDLRGRAVLRGDGNDERGEGQSGGDASGGSDHRSPFTITRSSNSRASTASLLRA